MGGLGMHGFGMDDTDASISRSPSLASATLSGDPPDGPLRLRTGQWKGRRAMHRLAMLVVSVMLALGTVAWSAPAATVAAQDAGYSPDNQESALVDLINGYRGSLGLGPLAMNYELGAAADYHSADMATNNYFDHYLYDGTDPGTNIHNFGFTGSTWGENIAAGMSSAQEVLTAWQNSPEHDAAMRNPAFTEVGIGRAHSDNSYYGWYWTADFGGGDAPNQAPVDTTTVLAQPDTPSDATTTDQMGTNTTVDQPPSVSTDDGGAVELKQNAVNADGDRAVSTGANPVADGTGDTVIYGDINTGGIQGESVVYEPPSYTINGDTNAAPAPAPDTTAAAPPAEAAPSEPVSTEPVYTDPTLTETTTTHISMEDGTGRAIGG
jgi:uncharacterized protein YkwD